MRLLKYKGKPYVGVRWDKYIELRSLTKDDEDLLFGETIVIMKSGPRQVREQAVDSAKLLRVMIEMDVERLDYYG